MALNESLSQYSSPLTKPSQILSLAAFIVLGCAGNTVVLCAIFRRRRLRTVPNLIILNLCMADILFCAIPSPIEVFHRLQGEIPPTRITCVICGVTGIFFCLASINTLVFVSIERFMATNYPLKHRYLFDTKLLKSTLVFIWFWSLLLCIVPLTTSSYGYSEKFFHCTVDWKNNLPTTLVLLVLGFFLPFTIIAYCNFHILRAMRKRPAYGISVSASNISAEKIRREKERQMSILVLTVIVTFMIFFTPYGVAMICVLNGNCTFPSQFMANASNLVASNSFCNPFIYGVMNKNFRKAFREILFCR